MFTTRKRTIPFPFFGAALTALVLTACGPSPEKAERPVDVGHSGSPLTASLYAAAATPEGGKALSLKKFGSPADVGYALLSGDIDAGFIEPAKLKGLSSLPGFRKLEVIGKVTYPYGATVILRKGLSLRLNELSGHPVAASSETCRLLRAFLQDAARAGLDADKLKLRYMPFETMIPALEAGKADAAVVKGAYAALALPAGHSILYQKWDVEAGDECCPPTIDQTEFILLARKEQVRAAERFLRLLEEAEKRSPAQLRQAVSGATGIPAEQLDAFPVGTFQRAGEELIELFAAHRHEKH
jgi:ABC-type nitrate/sulfonate/bicarbonate transport system substrate-binding protein